MPRYCRPGRRRVGCVEHRGQAPIGMVRELPKPLAHERHLDELESVVLRTSRIRQRRSAAPKTRASCFLQVRPTWP